jgi:hypothetical protein
MRSPAGEHSELWARRQSLLVAYGDTGLLINDSSLQNTGKYYDDSCLKRRHTEGCFQENARYDT